MKIQAVTFDVGGTLIEPWPSVGHVYASVASEHGLATLDPAVLNRQFREAWNRREGFDHSRAAWADLVAETFHGLADPERVGDSFEDLYERFESPTVWRVYPDVFPTIESLRSEGVRLGIISNWDERLRPLLRNLKLPADFEAVAISCEVGHSKPASEIFARAVELLGVSAQQTLHVGDRLREDVGAKNAGMKAVLLNRGVSPQSGQIPSLAVVPSLLDKLGDEGED